MARLPGNAKLFEMVGRCLTAWNGIESAVLQLLEYVHTKDGATPGEVAIGYWSIISFEARLKSADAVMRYRTRYPGYETLASEWNALNNHLIKKARKRAEVAHGSVIIVIGRKGEQPIHLFVPALERQRLSYRTSGQDYMQKTSFREHVDHLTEKELLARAQGFHETSDRITKFRDALAEKDQLSGFAQ